MAISYVLLFLAIAIALILVGLRVANALQEKVDRAQGREHKQTDFGWLDHIYGFWWIGGATLGGLKYVYREWKTAPVGSCERFGWLMLLAAIIAIALFAVLKIVDHTLNADRSSAPASGSDEMQ